ncbi:MAG: SPOR domain-containing protein [Flavobacteriales bacterium]|jgi:hypothetical protein|nr:SPOR domain-containing protein [Flavobacteriales bacterium]
MKPLYTPTISLLISIFFSFTSFASGLHFSIKIQLKEKTSTSSLSTFNIQKQTPNFIIAGPYHQYIEAMKAKQDLGKLGYSMLEIVAFFNHAMITIDEAFALMDNRNHQDKKNNGFMLTENELSELLLNVQNEEFFYTVQIGLFTEQNVNNFFDFPKQYEERITTKGNLRYTYGTYSTINDARAALKIVKNYGLDDAFIIAFDHLERIPINRAIEIENQTIDHLISENN